MESYLRNEETLKVISVEQKSVTFRRPDKFVYQARWEQKRKSQQAKPLKPGHDLFVTNVISNTSAEVERLTEGSLDGCKYMLFEYTPVSEQN